MNVINNKNVFPFITSDLNVFLKDLLEFRKKAEFINTAYMCSFSDNELAHFIALYLQYHTYTENLELKKSFLKYMGVYKNEMTDGEVESVFFGNFTKFYYSNVEEENTNEKNGFSPVIKLKN